jgi:biopolymer transport protein ExbD
MEWTEREITIAKVLSEKETQDFLRKVFVDIHTQKGEVLKMNIAALDDAEYGRLMKVLYMTKEENKEKINLIAKISKMNKSTDAPRPIAPK